MLKKSIGFLSRLNQLTLISQSAIASRSKGPKQPDSVYFGKGLNEFNENIKQAYRDLATEIEEGDGDSILNLLTGKQKPQGAKSEQNKTEQEKEDDDVSSYFSEMNRSLGQYLASLSPEEQLLRSKKLQQNMKNQKDWSINEGVNTDYQDYSLFDKNMLKIKSTSESQFDYKTIADLDFLKDLEPDVSQRKEKEDLFGFFYQDPAGLNKEPPPLGLKGLRKRLRKDNEELAEQQEEENNDPTVDFDEKQLQWNNSSSFLHDVNTVESDDEQYKPRLTLRARMQMFDLHNQGWSVRDLSLRFGAIPARVKAVIYQWKYFFDEIFPTIDMKDFSNLLSMEREYERIHEVCDYGIDMDEFQKIEQGYLRTIFKNMDRNVDIQKLEPGEQQKLRKLFKNKSQRKYDMVTEKFVGEGNKGYYIKSWLMYKTKSKPRVNELFYRILKDSDKPYKLPRNVQKRLELGPRRASMNYGFI